MKYCSDSYLYGFVLIARERTHILDLIKSNFLEVNDYGDAQFNIHSDSMTQ